MSHSEDCQEYFPIRCALKFSVSYLGIAVSEFWNITPSELLAISEGAEELKSKLAGKVAPMSRREFNEMLERFA